LFKDMDPATIGLEEALQLLSLPRVLGEIEGEPVVAQNGRYGPFIKRGNDTRSLAAEADLLTVTLPEAVAILAEPKRRRGQAAPKPPLRELGDDPVSGRPIVMKEGRFGPYVTDGETNASLRRGDEIDEVSSERAAELLQERREKEAAGLVGKRRTATRGRATGATSPSAKASTTKTSTTKASTARSKASTAKASTTRAKASATKAASTKAAATKAASAKTTTAKRTSATGAVRKA
jgi:DNA topoisomerase-1